MDSSIAIIFGIVQGLTEFLPISSSGHLLLLHNVFPQFDSSDEVAFDVALHLGTLVAVLGYFWRDVWKYLNALLQRPTTDEQRGYRHLAQRMMVAVIPAGLAGFFFEDIIESTLRSPYIVVAMLIIVALVFFAVEHWYAHQHHQPDVQMTLGQALFIGCAQAVALIPGTSRSGITLIAGMLTRLPRTEAARFSFVISIPLIAAAGLKKMIDLGTVGLRAEEIPLLLLGSIAAAAVGYVVIRFLLHYLQHHSLKIFAVYRIILAAIVLLLLSL